MTIFLHTDEALRTLEPRGDLAPPLATTEDRMPTWGKTLHREPDGSVTTGFWRCEPGSSRWDFHDRSEVIHVLDGVMHVTREGEDAVTLSAGMAAAFPKGWRGTWVIEQTISKFFVIYR